MSEASATIYADLLISTTEHVIDEGACTFLLKVVDKSAVDNWARIHVWDGWAFCLSLYRLHAIKLDIPNGSYDYKKVDGGYRLTHSGIVDDGLTMDSLTSPSDERTLKPSYRIMSLPQINVTAARSLSREGLGVHLCYMWQYERVRFIGMYPMPQSIESYYYKRNEPIPMTWDAFVSPEYLYDSILSMDFDKVVASMSTGKVDSTGETVGRVTKLHLNDGERYSVIACIKLRFPSDLITELERSQHGQHEVEGPISDDFDETSLQED